MRKLFGSKNVGLNWMFLVGFAFSPAMCKAEEGHCAWLNDATAAGFLNGPVSLDLETAPEDQRICTFTNLKTAKDYATLRIMVQPLKDLSKAVESHESQCTSAPTAIKGVGNEAISCSADVGYSRGEQIIGRVRDRLFIVTVSSTMAQDPMMTRQLLQEKARNISEQIAGALF